MIQLESHHNFTTQDGSSVRTDIKLFSDKSKGRIYFRNIPILSWRSVCEMAPWSPHCNWAITHPAHSKSSTIFMPNSFRIHATVISNPCKLGDQSGSHGLIHQVSFWVWAQPMRGGASSHWPSPLPEWSLFIIRLYDGLSNRSQTKVQTNTDLSPKRPKFTGNVTQCRGFHPTKCPQITMLYFTITPFKHLIFKVKCWLLLHFLSHMITILFREEMS